MAPRHLRKDKRLPLLAMDDFKQGFKSRRLTKQPPPSTSMNNTSMIQSNTAHLQRQPSSSQSPESSHNSHDQHRTPTSSSSSLEPSPSHSASQFGTPSSSDTYTNRNRYSTRQSFDEKADEFNAHPGTLSTLDSTKASGYQNSLRRPGPPPLSYTTPNAKMMSPSLRQSASFSIGDRSLNSTNADSETGLITSKRYSDEANGAKNSTPWKKKSSVSSFIGSFLGSPRSNSVKISAPENPVHVTHVGFDNETGQFTVCLSHFSPSPSLSLSLILFPLSCSTLKFTIPLAKKQKSDILLSCFAIPSIPLCATR